MKYNKTVIYFSGCTYIKLLPLVYRIIFNHRTTQSCCMLCQSKPSQLYKMSRSTLVPILPSEFKKSSYWESFFKKRVKAFEWYGTYYDLCGILHRYIKVTDQILMAGCGNSELSENLYDNGLKNIKNIDISKTVIIQMNKRKSDRDEMEYLQMDLLDLKFDDEMFSVIVDKGTLDAVMSDNSTQSQETTEKMFEEYSRVLKNGGRYILITLAQDFILAKVMDYFSSKDWLIRLHRICQVSEESGQPEMPVFAFVMTKFKKLSKKIFEICDNENFKPRRVECLDEVVDFVKSQQHYNILKSHINKQIDPERAAQPIELYSTNNSSSPRFVMHVVDKLTGPKTNVRYAVFIVPQGREVEWMFCSDEGRKQLSKQIPFQRILFVLLHRDHEYGSRRGLQDELNANVMDFAPPALSKDADVPYLSTGEDDLGQRVVRFKGESALSGPYVVEDYIGKENQWYRHLTFTRRDQIIQCEMRLKGKGQKDSGREDNDEKEIAVPDTTYIASQYTEAIIAGLAVRYKPEDFFSLMIIGVGGGTLSSFLLETFINCKISAVEIDEDLIEIGHKWFSLPRPEDDSRLQIHICDGLEFPYEEQKRLSQDEETRYDVIVLDVDVKDSRSGISCPPGEFLGEDYLKTIWSILMSEGVFVINLLCRSEKIKRKVMYNLRSCFKFIVTFRCTSTNNQVVFCFKEKPEYGETMQKKRKKKKKGRKSKASSNEAVSENKNMSENVDFIEKNLNETNISCSPGETGNVVVSGGENMAETSMKDTHEVVNMIKMFVLAGELDNSELSPPREKKPISMQSYDRCLLHKNWDEKAKSWENVWLKECGHKLVEICQIVAGMMVEQEVGYYIPR